MCNRGATLLYCRIAGQAHRIWALSLRYLGALWTANRIAQLPLKVSNRAFFTLQKFTPLEACRLYTVHTACNLQEAVAHWTHDHLMLGGKDFGISLIFLRPGNSQGDLSVWRWYWHQAFGAIAHPGQHWISVRAVYTVYANTNTVWMPHQPASKMGLDVKLQWQLLVCTSSALASSWRCQGQNMLFLQVYYAKHARPQHAHFYAESLGIPLSSDLVLLEDWLRDFSSYDCPCLARTLTARPSQNKLVWKKLKGQRWRFCFIASCTVFSLGADWQAK